MKGYKMASGTLKCSSLLLTGGTLKGYIYNSATDGVMKSPLQRMEYF